MAKHNMTLADMWLNMMPKEVKDTFGQEYTPEIFDKWMSATFYNGW